MKTLLSILFCITISLFNLPAHAELNFNSNPELKPTIGVLVGGQGAIRTNEKAMKTVLEKLEEKFPKAKYNLVADKQLAQDALVFAEDEEVTDIAQIKKGQLAKFGKAHNFDYIIALSFGVGHGRSGMNFWTVTYDFDVDLQAKVVEVASGNYTYRQNITGHGSSADMFGMPSSVAAFAEATKKCMETFCKEVVISPIKPEQIAEQAPALK